MLFRLQEIAAISPGANIPYVASGDGLLITPSFFTKGESPDKNQRIALSPKLKRLLLSAGDVLLIAKGREHLTFCYAATSYPAVPSSAFVVLRVHEEAGVTPEYLTWYLNQEYIQKRLSRLARGTSLPSLALADIENFTVEVPGLDTQNLIVRLTDLQRKKTQMEAELQSLTALQFQHQLYKLSQS